MKHEEMIKFLYNNIQQIYNFLDDKIEDCLDIRANKTLKQADKERKIYATIMLAALQLDEYIKDLNKTTVMIKIKGLLDEYK